MSAEKIIKTSRFEAKGTAWKIQITEEQDLVIISVLPDKRASAESAAAIQAHLKENILPAYPPPISIQLRAGLEITARRTPDGLCH